MKDKRRIRLGYANVMSTVAVFLALAGGSTAIAFSLPKNSVKSRHIANGAVGTSDLRNNAVKAAKIAPRAVGSSDIGADAVTGANVAEDTLGTVPSAARALSANSALTANRATAATSALRADSAGKAASASLAANAQLLDGLDSSAFARALRVARDDFSEGDALLLGVPGYGSFRLSCDDNDTPGNPGDDRVQFSYSHILGDTAIESAQHAHATSPASDAAMRLTGGPVPKLQTISFIPDGTVFTTLQLATLDRGKAITVIAGGRQDNTSTVDCVGQIQAFPSGT